MTASLAAGSDSAVQVILFDVNGVLVEFSGGPEDFVSSTVADPWTVWAQLQSVNDFERGKTDVGEFVRTLRDELALQLSESEIYKEFASWPGSLKPDAGQLLSRLKTAGYRVATISNTNPVHWPRVVDDPVLSEHVDAHFPSYITGYVKPDRKAFEVVWRHYGINPRQAMFFDDRLENVDAAQRFGMPAWQVRQIGDISTILAGLEVV